MQRYTFTLAAGIAPRDAQTAASTVAAFSAQFDTAAAPDREGPARVAGLRVDYRDLERVTLTWTSPTDVDFVGVLVVSRRGLVSERPAAGVAYAAGARLGGGEDAAEVVAVTRAGSWIDVTGGAAPTRAPPSPSTSTTTTAPRAAPPTSRRSPCRGARTSAAR